MRRKIRNNQDMFLAVLCKILINYIFEIKQSVFVLFPYDDNDNGYCFLETLYFINGSISIMRVIWN